MTRRYEDVEGCLGDQPNDPALYRWEAYPTVDAPTEAECAQDERDITALRTQYKQRWGMTRRSGDHATNQRAADSSTNHR